ncbi:hypothetical protein RSAG8_00937, partial [Rhizoctonia solani AG-8 WAC10335]
MQSASTSETQSDQTAATIATTGASTSSLFPSSRITKRKLQDALDALDDATAPSDSGSRRRGEGDDRPSPFKRANTSIYSSLAKYGIHVGRKPGNNQLACNVCGAAWIVGNATGMTREAASALIARHVTSLVQNHKNSCPWRLRQCDASIYRLPLKGSSALVRDITKRAASLPRTVERVLVKHPLSGPELEVLSAAVAGVEVSQDDTAPFDSATQITPSHYTGADLSQNAIILALFGWEQLSSTMKQTSFSSLDLVRNRSSSRLGHTRSTSGNGSGRSTPVPQGTTTLERKASGSVRSVTFADSPQRRLGKGREHEPVPLSAIESTSGDDESIAASHEAEPVHPPPRASTSRREGSGSSDGQGNDMVQCALCQRRVGLWTFVPPVLPVQPPPEPVAGESTVPIIVRTPPSPSPRTLDVLREHRTFCPYVMRTTPLTIPNGEEPSTEVEGWKAIVGIISRSKRRESAGEASITSPFRESRPGQQGVENAVSRVKRSPGGSRDLMRYVKGLLA